ncbi:MAG: right-handed parallel beta-helix repeat-containing protein [Actinobacteria bacterium]|nr:right-handed parallel beta-helix repeat-containing protein [Actinomycetota bacterium]
MLLVGRASATHVQCGETITQDTTLDSDLIDCLGNGIVIGADNIGLDMNGHTIDGDALFDPFERSESGIESGAHGGLKITNGTVQQFDTGVNLTAPSGFAFSRDIAIQRITARDNRTGIGVAHVDDLSAVHNIVVDNTGDGIQLHQSNEFDISQNFVSRNASGISMSHANVGWIDQRPSLATVSRNRLVDNRDAGLFIGESVNLLVSRNLATGNRWGLAASDSSGNTFEKNTASQNLIDGISLGGETRNHVLTKNRTDRNGDDGIEMAPDSEDNVLEGNIARFNADFGIAASASSSGEKNKAFGNGNPLQCLNVDCKTSGKK